MFLKNRYAIAQLQPKKKTSIINDSLYTAKATFQKNSLLKFRMSFDF